MNRDIISMPDKWEFPWVGKVKVAISEIFKFYIDKINVNTMQQESKEMLTICTAVCYMGFSFPRDSLHTS